MIDEFKSDVADWILEWVSVADPKLGTVPCPFARNALMSQQITWEFAMDRHDLYSILLSVLEQGLDTEVLVVGLDPKTITPENMIRTVESCNREIMPKDFVALEDHPDLPEIINGAAMNQGKWALVLLQRLSKLNAASEILRKQGYYDKWTQEQLDDVVTWRLE